MINLSISLLTITAPYTSVRGLGLQKELQTEKKKLFHFCKIFFNRPYLSADRQICYRILFIGVCSRKLVVTGDFIKKVLMRWSMQLKIKP